MTGRVIATGTALVLTALAAVGGAAFGLSAAPGDPGQVLSQVGKAAQNPATAQTAGFISAIVVLVILLIAYYCGGYVAGRMARFNGLRQGVAVWLWAIIIAALVAALTTVAGSRFNILATLSGLPRLPISEAILTTTGIVATSHRRPARRVIMRRSRSQSCGMTHVRTLVDQHDDGTMSTNNPDPNARSSPGQQVGHGGSRRPSVQPG